MSSSGFGIVRSGRHAPLEDAADEILRRELSAITRNADKSDILTPWKEQARRSREVYVSTGVPDGALRRGIYSRSRNLGQPHLNSVEAQTPKANKGYGPNAWDAE